MIEGAFTTALFSPVEPNSGAFTLGAVYLGGCKLRPNNPSHGLVCVRCQVNSNLKLNLTEHRCKTFFLHHLNGSTIYFWTGEVVFPFCMRGQTRNKLWSALVRTRRYL